MRSKKKTKVTSVHLELIQTLYIEKKASLAEVSRQTNLSGYELYNILKEHNLPLPRQRDQKKKLTATQIKRLLALYQDKTVTFKEILRRFGIRQTELLRHINQNNITMRSKEADLIYESRFKKNNEALLKPIKHNASITKEKELHQKINALYENDIAPEDIAKRCNIPLVTVYLHL